MEELALLGGKPVLPESLPPYRSVGRAEREAALRVLDSGCLSGFYGSWCEEFHGGPRVRELEAAWRARFGVRYALSVNSATSGLIAAMGAIGVEPGDEVIVPPWTMSATVVAPLFYGGIPVFADIESDTFCLDVEKVRTAIGPRTRAILAVDLFGHPARLAELRKLADERGIYLVEDAAQAPLAEEDGRLAGTIGHVGVYSLNHHKHIHCGEGGILVTDDDRLAERLALLRNHAESVVGPKGTEDITNLVGFNFRLTELSAAVATVQLARIDEHVGRRVKVAETMRAALVDLEGLRPPVVREGCRHVYYVWALSIDARELGVSRDAFCRALAAEGFPHNAGYVNPLYRLPLFQRRTAFGKKGHPFHLSNVEYGRTDCPVVERLQAESLVMFEPCAYELTRERVGRLVRAVHKVHALRDRIPKGERPK
ncbi:MAG: DegT/DnrJ/EryC1/StrS family aminotransferase [Planctomycetes bacterium]|nr:DegT/DnrJ/EryC1/StrS family aminotransferase [Planctomycetota bacterium]